MGSIAPLCVLAWGRFPLCPVRASRRWPGWRAPKGPFTPYHLGFVFGPRINAGGRVGRSSLGVDLLTTREHDKAGEFAAQLDLHNKERQAIEKLILEEAIAMAATQANAPFLLVAGDGWHPGVVGIVAGRLKERFGKPAFVAGFEGGMGRGSARSIPGIDVGGIIRAASEARVIEYGGGHAMAAGFSLTSRAARRLPQIHRSAVQRPTGEGRGAGRRSGPVSGCRFLAGRRQYRPGAGDRRRRTLWRRQCRTTAGPGRYPRRFRRCGGRGACEAAAGRRATGRCWTPSPSGPLERPWERGFWPPAAEPSMPWERLRQDDWNGRIRVQLEIEDAASPV